MMKAPVSNIELFSTEALLDPYPHYKVLRELGPAVWLAAYDMFILTRYDEVKAALINWQTFSSAGGVAMNDVMNEHIKGGLLCSDPPRHDVLRRVIERPLTPKALAELRDTITNQAESLVERLVAKGTFDAATELAQYLPVTIVADLVGLPEEGRERMLDWAAATFNCFGPANNELTTSAFPIVGEMIQYAFTECVPQKLKPGSWAQMIWDAADNGEIDKSECPFLMNDYMGPALDTTIFATTSAIWLFANNPDQWQRIRENPNLIPMAINEVIRTESPIQTFSRFVAHDHDLNGIVLPSGSRTIIAYGSANRDERKWRDPDKFDVLREGSAEHLGFGFGEHQCVGNNLARLEIRALLTALVKRVERFELKDMKRGINSCLRGIQRCIVTVH